jgi:coproporphyrinogen III oxidase-like Fe-S oxidoreductase
MRRNLGTRTRSQEYAMYRLIEARMQDAGMCASSPWCFSRHNEGMIDEYIVDAPEYLGLGSGSFSLLDDGLYVNTFSVARYAERLRAGRMSVERMRRFRPWELMHYRLMMGLFGLDLDRVGVDLASNRSSRLLLGIELFLLRRAGAFQPGGSGRFVLSHSGRYLSLAMMREFFAGMNQVRDESRALLPDWQRGELCENRNPRTAGCPECAHGNA